MLWCLKLCSLCSCYRIMTQVVRIGRVNVLRHFGPLEKLVHAKKMTYILEGPPKDVKGDRL
jgi:hypothetical protein